MSLKTTETLLGIETNPRIILQNYRQGLKTTETLLGIETASTALNGDIYQCLKTTETLLGIETQHKERQLLTLTVSKSQNY